MLHQQSLDLAHQRRRQMRTGVQKVCDFAEYPRPALGSAADHDGVCPRGLQHSTRLLRCGDVAIGHHRDMHRSFDSGNGVVLGLTLVALLACSTVHGQHLHPGTFKSTRQPHRVLVRLAPAGAHFECHRHIAWRTSRNHGLHDGQGQRFVLHQRRAGPLVANFLGGATHVDIDDLRTALDVVDSRLGHHLRIGAGNLHGNGARLAIVIGAPRSLECVPQVTP